MYGAACGSAGLGLRLGVHGSARREYGARVAQSSSTSGRVWDTSVSDEADSCGSEFVLMSSTLWNDQNLFLTTLKIQIYPKTLLFSDERGSDTNCWWEEPLVVALKHSEGIKHKVLLQNPKLTINTKLTTIHALSLYSVSLSFLHTK